MLKNEQQLDAALFVSVMCELDILRYLEIGREEMRRVPPAYWIEYMIDIDSKTSLGACFTGKKAYTNARTALVRLRNAATRQA